MFAFILFIVASFSLFMYEIMLTYGEDGFTTVNDPVEKRPFVSILISVRNEQDNIEALCESLKNLSYPKKQFEVLIGDDASDDNTVKLLKQHMPKNVSVVALESSLNGKLEVLKILTEKAKGEFLLFTDADVILNPDWIQAMLNKKGEVPRISSGVTTVRGNKLLDQLQNVDWLINQALIAWISKYLNPVSVWGNNMVIDKKSFDVVDGYKGMNPTIVEDVALLHRVIDNDGEVKIIANANAVCSTIGCPTFKELIHQRARWMKGSLKIPIFMKIGLIMRLFFLPAVLLLATYNAWVLAFILLKMIFIFLWLNGWLTK